MIPPVTTMQIYWGAVPFVLIQMFMVGLIIAFPGIVSSGLDKAEKWTWKKCSRSRSKRQRDYGADEKPGAATPPAEPGRRRRRPDEQAADEAAERYSTNEEEVEAAKARRAKNKPGTCTRAFLYGLRLRGRLRASDLDAVHVAVEGGLGEAEPQVLVARNARMVLVDLLELRRSWPRARRRPPSTP